MPQPADPIARNCEIPADCFNMITLARRRAGGFLHLRLPDLGDNVMLIAAGEWRCWNRTLGLLLSWEDFRVKERQGLHEPVRCTLKVHHSYSRTVIYRVFESLRVQIANLARRHPCSAAGTLLALPSSDRRNPESSVDPAG